MEFKQWLLLSEDLRELPGIVQFAKGFFDSGFNFGNLIMYSDYLLDAGYQSSSRNSDAVQFFRELTQQIKSPRRRTGPWRGQLVGQFYNIFGHQAGDFELNKLYTNSWFIVPNGGHQMRRPIVHPGQTVYRLSLTNGKWFVHYNDTDDRVSVVSTRHQPTPDSERWYPSRSISLRDFRLIPIQEVPDDVILFAFYKIIESQVRGSH